MTADNNAGLKKKAARISLLVGIAMFIAKISAYLITGSSAIYSDAAESVVHVLATALALYSIIVSSRPPDKDHLYGHSNIEYFSAGAEGILIAIAAITIIYSAIKDLVTGPSLQQLGSGTIIIGIAGLVNVFLGLYLIRSGKKYSSLALIADGKHVLTDSYTSLGVIVGLLIVMVTDIYILDPLVAIFVATNILYTGYKLVRESIGGLMNETDEKTLDYIAKKLSILRKPYWIDLHHLRFWKSSEKIFIDFHLTLPFYFTIEQSHNEENYIDEELKKELMFSQLRVHMDYCTFDLCKYCGYEPCPYRKEAKKKNINWETNKLIGEPVNPKSHLT